MNEPLVSILCLTYNHEPFICECLEGFLMQKTNFPFEILIHDDASTDKTANIIHEYEAKYPDIIKPIYQTENQYSKRVAITANFQLPRAKGKYIALCEGDDYWTDPYKLQKQVDFLEANPEYGLVYSEINRFYETTKQFENEVFKNILGIHSNTFEDFLVNAWFVAPCTWVFRKSLIDSSKFQSGWIVGDLLMLFWFSNQSKVHFLPEVTAVYRVLPKSISHHQSIEESYTFRKGIFDIQCYFAKKFKQDDIILTKIKDKFYKSCFIMICIYDDKKLRKIAYNFINIQNKLTLKFRFC